MLSTNVEHSKASFPLGMRLCRYSSSTVHEESGMEVGCGVPEKTNNCTYHIHKRGKNRSNKRSSRMTPGTEEMRLIKLLFCLLIKAGSPAGYFG